MTTGGGADASAQAFLNNFLSQYGLGSLGNTIWSWWKEGRPLEQIMLDIRATPEYKTRFPAMDTLSQAGRAISESAYINLEQSYATLAKQFGLPSGFYDQPSDFSGLIAGEVSPSEWQTRLQDYQTLAYDTDPTARNELQRLYGISDTMIGLYLTDAATALPVLQRQVGAAEVSAQAIRSGYGQLTQAEGELYSGLSPEQATQGFGQLVGLEEVLGQLPGEAGQAVGRGTALGAVFQGNETARQEIEARQRRRLAQFAQGGGYESSQSGISGVGSA